MDKYNRNNDTCILEAPALNPELKGLLTTTSKKRDGFFVATQRKVGSALVAIGNTLGLMTKEEEGVEVDSNKLLRFL